MSETNLIWQYFSKEKNSKLKAKCTYCSKVIAMSYGSTGNLSRHLKQVHKIKLREESVVEKQIQSEILEQTAFIEKALLFEVGEDVMHFEVNTGANVLVQEAENGNVENTGPILVAEVENVEETVVTYSLNNHNGSKRKRKSPMWNHFSIVQGNRDRAKCNYCLQIVSFKGSTGNLSRHLKLKHHGGDENMRFEDNTEEYILAEEIGNSNVENTGPVFAEEVGNGNEETMVTQSLNNNVSKGHSTIWNHFKVVPDSEEKAECRYCLRIMSFKGSTANLLRHLKTKHDENIQLELKTEESDHVGEVEYSNEETMVPHSKRKRKSTIWNHFSIMQDGGQRAKCKYCLQIFSFRGSSANLSRHLKLKHHDGAENMHFEINTEESILVEEVENDNMEITENTDLNLTEEVENSKEAMVTQSLNNVSKRHSTVWNHFSIVPDGREMAECRYCLRVMSFKGSTTNLVRHLKSKNHVGDENMDFEINEAENILAEEVENGNEEVLENTGPNFTEEVENGNEEDVENTGPNLIEEVENSNEEVLENTGPNLAEEVENGNEEVVENTGPNLMEEVENENEKTVVPQSLNNQDVSKRKRKSTIWNHFSIMEDDGEKAKCQHCRKIISFRGSSGNLSRHLKLKHHGKDENKHFKVNAEEYILAEEVENDEEPVVPQLLNNHDVSKRKRKSTIWNHFSIMEDDVEKAKCKHCQKIVSVKGGSGNLSRHLKLKHGKDRKKQLKVKWEKYILAEEVENDNEETIAPESLNKHKVPKRLSTVWKHYSVMPGGRKKAKCRYCRRVMSFKGSTANLLRHLRIKHRSYSILSDHARITNHQSVSDGMSPNLEENIEITHTKDDRNKRRSSRLIRVMTSENNDSRGDEGKKCLQNTSSEDKILLQPFNYIEQVPGKQIRTKLTKAFNHWLNIPPEKCKAIGEIVQMLHNASLLIDDIEDNSKLRRGVPVAHNIFGVASTINSANYVYFLGLEKTLKLDHPKATSVFTEQLLELHRGQGMEIYWRDNFICPTEEEYKSMVKKKTGGLFGLGVQLMQLFSENQSDFSKIIGLVGLFFQIRDDYANLKSQKYTENKSYCEDLTEGKFSFPIIHSIKNYPEDPRIMNIVRQRPTDVELKKYAVKLMEKFGSFNHCREVLTQLDQEARDEIEALGSNSYLLTVLDELNINSIQEEASS